MFPPLHFPPEGPDFEVWNHLHSALDLAENEFAALGPVEQGLVESIGKAIGRTITGFTAGATEKEGFANLKPLMDDPWVRHAADIEVGGVAVERASRALDRYRDLTPLFLTTDPSDKVRRYLSEAVGTYLLGFDAACIALAGAAVEQILLSMCHASGLVPDLGPRGKTPPFWKLVELLGGTLPDDVTKSAERAADHRNQVMHRSIWDDRILRTIARQSVEDLSVIALHSDQAKGFE